MIPLVILEDGVDKAKFQARTKEVLLQENEESLRYFYGSFAGEAFKGAVITQAHGVVDFGIRCHHMGINPGGELLCVEMPQDQIPAEKYLNRLLNKEEVLEIWDDAKSLREWEAEGHEV